MENVRLNNGITAPILGFGTYQISPSQTKAAVAEALKLGYRSIDTAQYYRNEAGVGAAVKASGLPCEELFITTKAMTTGYRATKLGIDNSLTEAGLDCFDLMLIHWPMQDDLGTYRALEEAYQAGKLRSIGVSNFNRAQLGEIMANFQTVPVVDQIETSVLRQQTKLHQYLADHQIVHEAWSPLGEGAGRLFNHPVLKELAAKYDHTTAQVMLRYLTQRQIMVIPRSTNPAHMAANINIFDFALTAADLTRVQALNEKFSLSGWPSSMTLDEDY